MLYSRTLFIHCTHNRLRLPTPDSQPVPVPFPSPLSTANLLSMSIGQFLCCGELPLRRLWGSIYAWCHTAFAFLWLPSLRMIVSGRICVAANGIILLFWGAFLVARMVKNLPAMRETQVRSLGWEDHLEKEMANHCSILAWKIPWTEEPLRLQSKGSYRVRHD